jgi:uncharacterized protein YndB with AHSA1/START domain
MPAKSNLATRAEPVIGPSLTLKRWLNAPPAKVYAAWTDPEKLMGWFGPREAKMLGAKVEARVGGRFHALFSTPDGEEHSVSGVYREVVPNRKLVFTWAWRSTPDRQSLVTIALKAEGAATLLTLTHEQFFDEAARDRHGIGWGGSLDKLEALFT